MSWARLTASSVVQPASASGFQIPGRESRGWKTSRWASPKAAARRPPTFAAAASSSNQGPGADSPASPDSR